MMILIHRMHLIVTLAMLLQEQVEDQQEPLSAWHLFQGGYIAYEACGAFMLSCMGADGSDHLLSLALSLSCTKAEPKHHSPVKNGSH